MTTNGSKIEMVQANNQTLSSCDKYGENALIINEDGGIYIGNNSIEPKKIADKFVSAGNGKMFLANDGVYKQITNEFVKLASNNILKFYCIEPVEVIINEESTVFDANTNVNIFIDNDDEFSIIPTSNNSISSLNGWPGPLNYFYDWLEGVQIFDSIIFDMNDLDMYEKWNQGNQGLYHVQFAQYKNCIFWSDNAYISTLSERTNYTLYYTSELPLCYSTIPDNTFKSFYFAYNVTCDPNWSNPVYKESFAKATWATQVFSYYGMHSIGMFDIDSTRFNITLPKDCRGLMYYAPNVLNAGVFDAINTTNFGAKSGSWREAFGCCYQLTNLYIKNLKVNLNISWSPVNQQSMAFILDNAANTNAITIWLSPHTYYGLTDANKTLAAEKNITLALIDTNTTEDNRLTMLQMTGDGNSYLANDGTYKTIEIPEVPSLDGYAKLEDIPTIPEIPTVPTKVSAFENDSNYVSLEVVQQMIADAIANLNKPEEPETPVDPEPDTPEEPETPTESIGSITDDNSIVIDETQLENGTYTLRYIDANENVIDNFNEITTFEINK